jgi:hypothetical protein
MKKFLILCSIIFTTSLFAQKEIRNADGSYFKQCSSFQISKPLSQLAKEHPAVFKKEQKEAKDAERKRLWKTPSNAPFTDDPIAQKTQGTNSTNATIKNFNGQQSAGGYDPLDPTGMVGPNHYVQAVNSNYQIFDKIGTALTAPIDLATLFPGSLDDGDPIVMYDKFADRWVITEFLCPGGGNCTKLLFAVSTTNDPTGTYYLYTFEPDAADYADYPKYSIWSDGYYETCNCDNQKVTVYERAKMLVGDTSAGFIVIPSIANPNTSSGSGFFCPQTLFADGQLPPYGSPQYLFYFTDDNWGAGFTDQIHIYKITSNWINKTGTFTSFSTLTPQPFNSYFTGGTEKDISQPSTTTKLDALDGFFSYRIPYMRWSNYNSAVLCNAVNTGNTTTKVSGIRWYELRQDTSTQAWSIFQQGTYSPADGVSRWNSAIAMDMNGSISLAYSVSAPTAVYPGIRYTGRTNCDTLGIMSLTETTAIAGTTAYTSDNRWGDYSHTSLDPSDGLTFWHTNQYIGSGHSLNTRIFSFQIPACITSGIKDIADNNGPLLFGFQSGNQLHIKATNLSKNESSSLGLFDMRGRTISNKLIYPSSEIYETDIDVSTLEKGIYFIQINNSHFQRVVKILIQ